LRCDVLPCQHLRVNFFRAFRPLSFVVLLASTALLSSCGGAVTSGHGFIPKQAIVTGTVSLDRSDSGEWRAALTNVRRVPSFQLVEKQIPSTQKLLEAIDDALKLRGTPSMKRDVAPWLGKRGGGALWFEKKSEARWMVWADVKDEDSATSRLKSLLQAKDAGSLDGATIYAAKTKTFGHRINYAVVDSKLLVSDRKSSIVAALNAHSNGSLEDGDDYERFSHPTQSTRSLATFFLAKDSAKVLTRAADKNMTAEQRAEVKQQLATYAKQLPMAVHVGANDSGLYLETMTTHNGTTSRGHFTSGSLDKLPQNSVAAVVANVDTHNLAERAKQGSQQMRDMLDSLPATDTPSWLVTFMKVGDALLSSGQANPMPVGAFDMTDVILERKGQFAFAGRAEYGDDAAKWRAYTQGTIASVARVLKARTPIRLSYTLSNGDAPTGRIVIGGIPGRQAVTKIARMTGTPAATLLAHPAVRELAAPTQTMTEQWTTDGTDEGSVPPWGLPMLQNAGKNDTPTLGDAFPFSDAVKTIGAPRRDERKFDMPTRVNVFAWVDLRQIVHAIAEPIDARVSYVTDQQLAHAPGLLMWGWTDDDTSHAVLAVPFLES
jgi:hypothetical protein